MAQNFPPINKIFDDLDKFRDYCRFEGKVFNEADLYKNDSPNWIAYQKYLNWSRSKSRNEGRPFTPRPRKQFTPRFERRD
jgi:hypothetical protein